MSNEDDVTVDCDEKALTLFGCDREKFIGKTPRAFSSRPQPEVRRRKEQALEEDSAAVHDGENSFEWRCKRFDGAELDAEIVLSLINLPGGMQRNHLQPAGMAAPRGWALLGAI